MATHLLSEVLNTLLLETFLVAGDRHRWSRRWLEVDKGPDSNAIATTHHEEEETDNHDKAKNHRSNGDREANENRPQELVHGKGNVLQGLQEKLCDRLCNRLQDTDTISNIS